MGREVRLAANDIPRSMMFKCTIFRLIATATQVDAIFGALELGIVNTGSSMPLLDLSNISQALAHATEDAGLLVFVAWDGDWRVTGRRRLTSQSSGSLRSKTRCGGIDRSQPR